MVGHRKAVAAALATGFLVVGLGGCWGDDGDSGGDATGSLPRLSLPPAGPIPYAYVQNVFTPPPPGNALPRAGGCGTVMSNAGAGLTVAAGVVSFVPVIGPVLGAIDNAAGSVLTLFGANAGSACLQNQINALSTQLNNQQAEIAQINEELGLVYAALYQQAQQTADDVAGISKTNLATLTTNVQAAYNSELAGLGLWVNGQAGGNLATLGIWSSGAQTPTGTTNMTNARAALTGINTTYAADLGASYVAPICPSVLYPDPTNGPYQTVACYTNVSGIFPQGTAVPAVVLTYQAYATALATSITATQKQTPPGNVVPLFDQYNTAIVSLFQQSVFALQLMYQMEYLANQANYWWSYNNFTTGQGNPNFGATSIVSAQLTLPSATNVSGVQYQYAGGGTYNAQSEAVAYNSAQQQLSLLYAAYLNQLYLTTLGYLYTDPLAQGQSWPGPTTITLDGQSYTVGVDYASVVGSGIGSFVTTGPYPYQTASSWVAAKGNPAATPPVTAQAWTQNAVLYQFAGLQNAGACLSNLAAYVGQNGPQGSIAALTQANPGWCPSVYPTASGPVVGGAACGAVTGSGSSQTAPFVPGSYYDGRTVIPWYANPTTGVLSLAGGFSAASKCTLSTTGTGANTTTTLTLAAVPRGMVGNLQFCAASGPSASAGASWSWYAPTGSFTGNPAGLVAGTTYLNCNNWTQPAVSNTFSDFFNNVGAGAWLNISSTENTLTKAGSSDGFCYTSTCGSIVYNFPQAWEAANYIDPTTQLPLAGTGAYNGTSGYGFMWPCEAHKSCPLYQPAMYFQNTWAAPAQQLLTGAMWYPAQLSLALVVTVGGSGSSQYSQFNIVPPPQYSSSPPFGNGIIYCTPQQGTGQWNATLNCYFVDGTGVSYVVQRNTDSSGEVNGIATFWTNLLN